MNNTMRMTISDNGYFGDGPDDVTRFEAALVVESLTKATLALKIVQGRALVHDVFLSSEKLDDLVIVAGNEYLRWQSEYGLNIQEERDTQTSMGAWVEGFDTRPAAPLLCWGQYKTAFRRPRCR